MKEGQSVQDHLKNMKEIVDKLAALGSKVAEDEPVVALLIGLPSSYTTLATALEAKGDELSLSFVQKALINEEQKRDVSRKAVTLASSKESALHVQKEAKRFVKGRCYKCNREGHKSFECTQNSFKYKKAFKHDKHNLKTAENQEENATDLQLFIMNTEQTRKGDDTQLVMDCGASQHMTANKHLLTNYQEFDVPETVRLGDGHTVDAYGSGQVKITVRICQNKDISTLWIKCSLLQRWLAAYLVSELSHRRGTLCNFDTVVVG